jgi:hypothetical protein
VIIGQCSVEIPASLLIRVAYLMDVVDFDSVKVTCSNLGHVKDCGVTQYVSVCLREYS